MIPEMLLLLTVFISTVFTLCTSSLSSLVVSAVWFVFVMFLDHVLICMLCTYGSRLACV